LQPPAPRVQFREFIGILKEDEEERPADKKKGKK
jgi:hypothetical protein